MMWNATSCTAVIRKIARNPICAATDIPSAVIKEIEFNQPIRKLLAPIISMITVAAPTIMDNTMVIPIYAPRDVSILCLLKSCPIEIAA